MDAYDVVVVGYGLAGVAAAIEAADAGARVLALDRAYGGGASALSGGVVYAGGGTRQQEEAGLTDSPDAMFDYLAQETMGVVSEKTLRRFCETSPAMIAWLEDNGAEFRGTLCGFKTSYPPDPYYLYYSGNEKAWPYAEHAAPAARGHRQVAKGLGSGAALLDRLRRSAAAKGVEFRPLSRVEELVIEGGAVTGVRFRTMAPRTDVARRHERLTKAGGKLGNWLPPLGARFSGRAEALWQANSRTTEVRANAVILSAGGFVFNPAMKAEHAVGAYAGISPLGTVGDDGGAIALGRSAGGTTAHLDKMSAWRFVSPPSTFIEGVSVGPGGHRIINEDLYGATFGDALIRESDGRGFLVVDARQWKKARGQIRTQAQRIMQIQLVYLFTKGHRKAPTLAALARKLGVPPGPLAETVAAYNDGIRSGGDPAHKAPDMCSPVETGPFYAIDVSIVNAAAFPAPGITLGGLRVDEETGEVLRDDDTHVPGLYAAGRSAVGLCSNSYVSGLSLADCVFSGRRAGGHAAGPVPANGR